MWNLIYPVLTATITSTLLCYFLLYNQYGHWWHLWSIYNQPHVEITIHAILSMSIVHVYCLVHKLFTEGHIHETSYTFRITLWHNVFYYDRLWIPYKIHVCMYDNIIHVLTYSAKHYSRASYCYWNNYNIIIIMFTYVKRKQYSYLILAKVELLFHSDLSDYLLGMGRAVGVNCVNS